MSLVKSPMLAPAKLAARRGQREVWARGQEGKRTQPNPSQLKLLESMRCVGFAENEPTDSILFRINRLQGFYPRNPENMDGLALSYCGFGTEGNAGASQRVTKPTEAKPVNAIRMNKIRISCAKRSQACYHQSYQGLTGILPQKSGKYGWIRSVLLRILDRRASGSLG